MHETGTILQLYCLTPNHHPRMSLTLKVTHKGISRVIQFNKGTSEELSFSALQLSITAVFADLKNKSFYLTRQDEDGDLVAVSSDAELTETVRMFQASTKPTKGSCPRFTVKLEPDPAVAASAPPAAAPTTSAARTKAPAADEKAYVVPSAPPAPSTTEEGSGEINWALPKYEKYRKMLTLFSEKPVRDKMKGDKEGFTLEQLDSFFAQYGKPGGQSNPPVQAPAPAPYNPYADPNYKIPSVFRVVEPPINWNAAKYSKYRKLKGVLFEGGIRKRLYDDGFTNDEIEAYFQPWPGKADETTIVGALLKIAIGGVQAAPLAVSNEQHRHDAPKHHPAPPVYAEMQAVDGQWVPLHQGQVHFQHSHVQYWYFICCSSD